ncbi:MAG: ABC transporter substrate-binding protein [Candidatus Binatia bacterium]
MLDGSIKAFAFALILIVASTAAAASSDPKVIEGAKKEGKATWYTTTIIQDATRLIAAFNQKHPFVKVELLRMGSAKAVNRVETEARAGKFLADVLNINDTESVGLQDKAFFQKYASPELKYYPKELLDPAGYAFPFKYIPNVIGYNTRLVPASEAPTRYEDLLAPKWKSKILIDSGDFRLYSALIQYWGKERALKFLMDLAKQDIQWRPGHLMLAQNLAAGETSLGLIFANHAEILRSKGAPIDWDTRLDPVFLSANSNFIPVKAPHLNAAKLFVDFTLSKEGQTILVDTWRITPHPEVPPKTSKLDPKNLKLVLAQTPSDEVFQQQVKEWMTIFRLK